ncbi:hypothetical protein BCR44DRAFT_1499037 [Catenaria anguillulae PL171]|uniref:Centrosomal protein POC5 n=1 Tax=Catenaria anguillulae PL171 TaxID=765915 RepID=A0A1Y2HSQ5_9FUNG|nr:hypothetical protein BCR44DRAFT_1499037 [Catenaria anguillulae PL171]
MRNHSAAGSRTHSRQGSTSSAMAVPASVDPVPPTTIRPATTSVVEIATVPSPPPYHHKESLPPQLSKWVTTLQSAFAADLHQLQDDLDASNRAALAASATAHAAQMADMESKLAEAHDALARAQPAIKYRPHAHRLLVDTFRARQDARMCAALFLLWKRRAHLVTEEHRKMVAANRHTHQVVLRKAFNGWFRVVREAWRQERDQRLDEKTKVAVAQATHDLESRLRDLARELQDEKRRRHELVREQKVHEAEMRAAFVRGLSALNMETMAVLQPMMASQASHRDSQDDADGDNESIIVVQSAVEEQSILVDSHLWNPPDQASAPAASASTGGNFLSVDNPADPLRLSVLSGSYSSIRRSASPIPSGIARTSASSLAHNHQRPTTNSAASRPASVASNHPKAVPATKARNKANGGSTSASRRSSFTFRAPDDGTNSARAHAPDPVRLMQGKKHHSSTASIKSLREPVYVERHARPAVGPDGGAGAGVGAVRGQTGRVGPGMATGFFSP